MIRRLEDLDFEILMESSVEKTKDAMVQANLDQMYAGKRKDQQPIYPLYAPRTIARKKKKGQPFDRVTLKDKGELYAKAGAIVDNDTIRSGSDVPYADDLEKRYGKEIWGIGGPYKVQYIGVLKPVFVDQVRVLTGMK